MALPNLFVPGAMKSGTTTLHELLGEHPDIFMSKNKEPNFWTDDARFPNFKSYEMLFEDGQANRFRGESSTGYMVFDNFIERIKAHLDEEPHFIFVLRNPVDRVWSHYWFLRGMGYEKRDFETAFLEDLNNAPDLRKANFLGESRPFLYQFGLYGKWLSRFYANFPKEKIYLLPAEELFQNPDNALQNCFRFLGLPPHSVVGDNKRFNETRQLLLPKFYHRLAKFLWRAGIFKPILDAVIPKIWRENFRAGLLTFLKKVTKKQGKHPAASQEIRAWIAGFYREDVAGLRKLTGLKFEHWEDFQ